VAGRGAADVVAVGAGSTALRGVDDEVDLARRDEVHRVGSGAVTDLGRSSPRRAADEATDSQLAALRARFADVDVLPVSVLDDASLDALREKMWQLTGLIRVYLRKDGEVAEEPLALTPPATVLDVADAVHHDLASSFTGARLWGPSARFDGQRVGREQPVQDGDTVEILTAV